MGSKGMSGSREDEASRVTFVKELTRAFPPVIVARSGEAVERNETFTCPEEASEGMKARD
jgi:hypothetical protein